VIKLGTPLGVQELDPCRKLTLHKPDSTQCVRKPRLRWLESVEEDLKKMGIRNWRCKLLHRKQWRTIFEVANVHQGL
jgi:hypothetical protein